MTQEEKKTTEQKLAYRRHLDAIRGLACMAVILFHCDVPYMDNGWLGVDVFFVLSGFLITSVLLRELIETGHVDLPRYRDLDSLQHVPIATLIIVEKTDLIDLEALFQSPLSLIFS